MGLPSGSHDKVERGQGSSLSPGLPEQELEGGSVCSNGHWPLAKLWKPNADGVPVVSEEAARACGYTSFLSLHLLGQASDLG